MTTSFETIRARTAELQQQIEALKKEAAEQIKPLLQQFITDNPQVEAVRWHQYTPYFNDGDACVFRMGDIYFKFDGLDGGGEDGDGFFSGVHTDNIVDGKRGWLDRTGRFYESGPTVEACSIKTAKACGDLATELSGLEDALESLFGDHVEVTVTKAGVSVDEYDHD